MSDHNIAVPPAFFKEINIRIERLGHLVDQLDLLVYQYKHLENPLETLTTISFEFMQEYSLLRDSYKKATAQR